MIGDRLGKWTIFKELGRGGMGRVYLAQEELDGRKGAVKVLAAELAQDAGFLHRFQREIETLRALDHPNIVRFYESGFENGVYFYAMEYVEGQSLEEILHERDRLPWGEVLDIALQLCPALKHVHDHGVIHRDIKPPNVLITPEGKVKLTDFGIAKVFASSHLTATGGVVGTAEFLSPEQAAGKPVTKRSDLYSLGVVLYAALTGRTPFEGASFLDLLHKHRYGQFDRPQTIVPQIPHELDEVVCKLLEKDPAARPADCLVLGRQLESIRRKLERRGHVTQAGGQHAATVAEHSAEAVLEDAPGPATLMSRLMRDELEREKRGNLLSRAFNSAWVLVPALALVLGILVWTFWPVSAEALFERGKELMESRDLGDKERAWREYLGPLEERFPDHPYKEEVAQYRRQLEEARARAAAEPPPGEAQRFYLQGERLRLEGKEAEARRVWKGVVDVFGGDEREKEWVGKAEVGLAELDRQAARERLAPARAALKRAATLRDQGKRAEAERIWAGLEVLYGADESARDLLIEVRAARKQAGGK
ncbi:MAG: protein kinase [Gemmataceae bacterium]|nr:protein kinase [Gemmataceae bacterium]